MRREVLRRGNFASLRSDGISHPISVSKKVPKCHSEEPLAATKNLLQALKILLLALLRFFAFAQNDKNDRFSTVSSDGISPPIFLQFVHPKLQFSVIMLADKEEREEYYGKNHFNRRG